MHSGVLDPEELSAMNNGFKGLESSLFPGIPEDLKMRRSVDSDLTFESLESDAFSLDSDAFSLESFDGDLFEDVRASIHRSCGPLHLRSASCDSVPGKAATQNVPGEYIAITVRVLGYENQSIFASCDIIFLERGTG